MSVLQQVDPAVAAAREEANALIEDNFGRALGTAIYATFPVASIIGIINGCRALKAWEKTKEMEKQYGFVLTGKHIPTRILALVGKIAGIAMTAFWGFYLILIVLMIVFSTM